MEAKPKRIKKPRGVAELLEGKCIACGARCQSVCPTDAIEMTDAGEPIIDVEKCIGCQKCIKVCPAEALILFYTPEQQEQLKAWEESRKQRTSSVAVEEERGDDRPAERADHETDARQRGERAAALERHAVGHDR